MADGDKRIALLIDADNAPASKIDVILAEVARQGTANVRRAYGDWKSPHLKQWEDTLHTYAIKPIQQFAYSRGKNASDMAMVIDAMDLLYARNLDAFAIVSSDADFTPLVMRLLTDGLRVYGFGAKKTPAPFVNACSQFTFVEGLVQPSEEPGEPALLPADRKKPAQRHPSRADAAQRDRRRRLGPSRSGRQSDRQSGVVRPAQLRLPEAQRPRRGHRAVRGRGPGQDRLHPGQAQELTARPDPPHKPRVDHAIRVIPKVA